MMEEENLVCRLQRELNIAMGKAAEKISLKILPGSRQGPDI